MKYTLLHTDRSTRARAGLLETAHGPVETPIFMPVGTIATVKSLSPDDLRVCAAQVMLSNTYHLYLRPGTEVLEQFGGLHRFNRWDGPILTDSGGFQIYSLNELIKSSEDGVEFKSHYDGSTHLFTPERVVDIQRSIGSDIMMVLDYLTGNPADYATADAAHQQTLRWAARSRDHFLAGRPLYDYPQYQFGIVQGGIYPELRRQSISGLLSTGFDGYAIGGLAVGEDAATRREITGICNDQLPEARPRYLMGVGKPEDILDGIEVGVDMFDCVMPSRNARNGSVFTGTGKLNLRNARHRSSQKPIDSKCGCYACSGFSIGYIHHMLKVNEMFGLRLATQHNIHFYLNLVRRSRAAVLNDQFADFKNRFLVEYSKGDTP